MKKIEQEAEENVIEIVMEIYFVKMEMEIVINKSLCEEVEFLRFCFFFLSINRRSFYLFSYDCLTTARRSFGGGQIKVGV